METGFNGIRAVARCGRKTGTDKSFYDFSSAGEIDMTEDSRKICEVLIRGLKMIIKLLENLIKEK
jgi:hypothetical protein